MQLTHLNHMEVKVPIFSTFWEKVFLRSNIRPQKIFFKSNNLCTKKLDVATTFLKSRLFLKSGFLKSRFHCIMNWSQKNFFNCNLLFKSRTWQKKQRKQTFICIFQQDCYSSLSIQVRSMIRALNFKLMYQWRNRPVLHKLKKKR